MIDDDNVDDDDDDDDVIIHFSIMSLIHALHVNYDSVLVSDSSNSL